MSVTKSDKSITDRLLKLEYNDERRESHSQELKKDIQVMADNQRQITGACFGALLQVDAIWWTALAVFVSCIGSEVLRILKVTK
jgi:hypothetical protein